MRMENGFILALQTSAKIEKPEKKELQEFEFEFDLIDVHERKV